jgi:hypothetical protein
MKMWFWVKRLSIYIYIYIYICMCVCNIRAYVRLLALEKLDDFYFVFSIQEFIHHTSVPGEYEHSKSKKKKKGPTNGPEGQNFCFLENDSNGLDLREGSP